jgi:ubiquinone/menaquinone biosynthesis C-methylase UbiE
MDAPDADPELLHKSLAYIRWVNRLFRYTRAMLSHIERFSRKWKPGEQIRILDVGTGSADIPRAILNWADRRGFNIHVIGVDLQAVVAAEAAASNPDSRLGIVRANALDLPFADESFDYAITSMFLHHLDDEAVVKVFREMSRVASRGILAADISRNRRSYMWINLFTLLANPMVRHDARVSVRQAFNRAEVMSLRDRAGINFASYHRHFGHRFILGGEKSAQR